MRTVSVTLESICPYYQSAPLVSPKLNKESAQDYEERCWRDRIHATPDGFVEIPPMPFKFAIDEVAKKLRITIPGKGKSEYGGLLKGGVVVQDGIVLPIKKEDVPGRAYFLNADGKRGSGTRVKRIMPHIESWSGTIQFLIVDDAIPKDIFERHLTEAGLLIGIGQNRPGNGGYRGRFKPTKFVWSEA